MNKTHLKDTADQAKSYALMPGLPSFVVASPEGMWLFSLKRNEEQLVKKIMFNEIPKQKEEEEFRPLHGGIEHLQCGIKKHV